MKDSEAELESDVAIIGAGPIGSYTALRLVKKGYSVLIIEEDPMIGRPQQCAGLVNSKLFDLEGIEDLKEKVILNRIIGADIISPSGNILKLRGKRTKAYSIDRAHLDNLIFKKAVSSGAVPLVGQKIVSVKRETNCPAHLSSIGIEGEVDIKTRTVIGCEGTPSITRSSGSMDNPKHVIPGLSIEGTIEGADNPLDLVSVITGKEIAQGFFSWAVPAGDKGSVRLGLAAMDGISLKRGIRSLLNDKRLRSWLGQDDGSAGYISWNYGSVPMGSPRDIFKNESILLGDSAGMAKPTSGGGIFPGMKAVDSLMSVIVEDEVIDLTVFNRFKQAWKKGYGRELERSRVFRNIISRIRDDEIEMVIKRLSEPELISIINEKGDIDHPLRLALSLIKKDPSLLKLIPRFLPNLRKLS
ncbi:MAG: NAD(P)/FAD-dependent oxidoreductase [Thermoplasmatota archaeon]